MTNIDRVASRQRIVYASGVMMAMVAVLSLSACVDLAQPWKNKAQDGGASDARGIEGNPDTAIPGSGGTGGTQAGTDSSTAPGDKADANTGGGGSASSVGGGGSGGTAGSGGVGGATEVRDAGGANDAQRADGAMDSPVESSSDSSGDGGGGRETKVGSSDSLGESGRDGGADSSSDSRADSFETSSGIEVASDGPSPIEVGADMGARADLAFDLSPDLAPDLPPDQATCKPSTYDAKKANHSAGQEESDGWYLSATGQFLWLTGIDYPAGRTTVTVVARGDFASGAWPSMDVSAQGQSNIIGTATVSSASMTAYNFTFDAAAMNSGVGVTAKSGNGVHVQSITIGCPTH